MIAALKAEFRKLFSTRMWWVLMACGCAYLAVTSLVMAGMVAVAEAAVATNPELTGGGGPLVLFGDEGGGARMIYSMAGSFAYVFPLLIGALSVTQEYRHKTITQTFLAEPRRHVVLGAKMLASLPMGLAYGLGCLAAVVLPAALILQFTGNSAGFGAAATWALLGRSLVDFTIWATFGVGLGCLIKNQVALVVVALAETQAVEPMLRTVPPMLNQVWDWTQFLPGAAGDAIQGSSIYDLFSASSTASLSGGPAVLVLLGWAVALAALGYAFTFRRDVS